MKHAADRLFHRPEVSTIRSRNQGLTETVTFHRGGICSHPLRGNTVPPETPGACSVPSRTKPIRAFLMSS